MGAAGSTTWITGELSVTVTVVLPLEGGREGGSGTLSAVLLQNSVVSY